jgi:S-formylglutathione hydrolase
MDILATLAAKAKGTYKPETLMDRIERHVGYGGSQDVWKHASSTVSGEMNLDLYLAEAALHRQKCLALYWLSGLTCLGQNFITKASTQSDAEEYGTIVVAPDTSPRGSDAPDPPDYALGQDGGFHTNAVWEWEQKSLADLGNER